MTTNIVNEAENALYQILGAVSATDAPIAFKGALITKLILSETEYNSIIRSTSDIDANWVGEKPSMEEIKEIVGDALQRYKSNYKVEVKREYGENRSAGLVIIDKNTEKKVVSMDVDLKPIYGIKTYYYGEIEINGVLPTDIMADKIYVLSSSAIFKRAKDMVDVYALSHCVNLTTSEIYETIEMKGREVGEFKEFLNSYNELNHAYNRLLRIQNKPPFEETYKHLKEFLAPFIYLDRCSKIWRASQLYWQNGIMREITPIEY